MYSERARRTSPKAPGPRQTGGGSSREEEGFDPPTGSVQLRFWSERIRSFPVQQFSSDGRAPVTNLGRSQARNLQLLRIPDDFVAKSGGIAVERVQSARIVAVGTFWFQPGRAKSSRMARGSVGYRNLD